MARELVVADPAKRVSAAVWARYEQVGLEPELELDELVLNWTDRRVRDLDARGALVALSLERTIEGGSTVTMKLRDPNARLFAGKRTVERTRGLTSAQIAVQRKHPVEVDEG